MNFKKIFSAALAGAMSLAVLPGFSVGADTKLTVVSAKYDNVAFGDDASNHGDGNSLLLHAGDSLYRHGSDCEITLAVTDMTKELELVFDAALESAVYEGAELTENITQTAVENDTVKFSLTEGTGANNGETNASAQSSRLVVKGADGEELVVDIFKAVLLTVDLGGVISKDGGKNMKDSPNDFWILGSRGRVGGKDGKMYLIANPDEEVLVASAEKIVYGKTDVLVVKKASDTVPVPAIVSGTLKATSSPAEITSIKNMLPVADIFSELSKALKK
ncbi:MAG: hypothetical protein LBR54_05275 [Oscillospiraceae bacterium]|jgi:hypothetical protein|nr:hypothetical protein [Oscillospiraceae bacterium]